jgi:hypothetical protein
MNYELGKLRTVIKIQIQDSILGFAFLKRNPKSKSGTRKPIPLRSQEIQKKFFEKKKERFAEVSQYGL